MIKDALSALPTRPVIYIVPLVVIVVMLLYYHHLYSGCQRDVELRQQLQQWLQGHDVTDTLRLAEFTDFDWEKLRIIPGIKPGGDSNRCPFGWGIPDDRRNQLIRNGLLTVMIFVYDGQIVEYLEVSGSKVLFTEKHIGLSPETAVFRISDSEADSEAVKLELVNQDSSSGPYF